MDLIKTTNIFYTKNIIDCFKDFMSINFKLDVMKGVAIKPSKKTFVISKKRIRLSTVANQLLVDLQLVLERGTFPEQPTPNLG